MTPRVRPQEEGAYVRAGLVAVAVGHDRLRVRRRGGVQLVRALRTRGLHVDAAVVPKRSHDADEVHLAVGMAAQAVVGDGDDLGTFEVAVAGHLA
jgi:hypothetical protein